MAPIIDGSECITAEAAAEQLATTTMKILMLLKDNALQGTLVEGEWYVTADSVACYKSHGSDHAEQRSCRTSCSGGGCGCS